MPVAVDLSRRLETEQAIVRMGIRVVLMHLVRERVLGRAVPLNHVSIALQLGYANTEVVQLISELSSEFVDESFVVATNVALSHSFSNHLCHLVTSDVAVALEGRVAITIDNAISSQLRYSVISPMVSRNIGERVCSSESRAGSANNQSGRQSRYESLFHEELLLK